jgi:HK97 family phage major capsid protein/HK97 family phage prohead protease
MLNRAYSLLSIKSVDEDARILTGMATTPTPDRLEDVVEPEGAQFKLPLPLLWQHDSRQPIGHVTHAKVGKDGIAITAQIARIVEPGRLKDRLDEAWQSIKAGLVTGLSIGFKGIEVEPIEDSKSFLGGLRFLKWEFLELSAVTIPANAECTIATVKSLDVAQRAAPGPQMPRRVVRINPAGASALSKPMPVEGNAMKTIAEQITALEAKRQATAARMEALMQRTLDEDRTSDQAEGDEFDTLNGEVEAIDKDLVRLRAVEKAKALAAKPVGKAEKAADGAEARSGSIIVKSEPKLPPGIWFTRMAKCQILSHRLYRNAAEIAAERYGADSSVVAALTKAAVPAGSTVAGNWAANLISAEGAAMADFIEYLRPQTILGRFGTNGIPALRSVPFRVPLIAQTGGGAAYWVGEGKAKPLTSFAFTRTTLTPLKCANICVLTEESVRDSSPKSDTIVRDALAAALRERLDLDFITPSKTAVAGVSPASITNGAPSIASTTGTDADSVRLDVRSLYAKFSGSNNPPSTGVWVMSTNTSVALAMMTNALGQAEFPTMGMTGGTLSGMPVISSDYVANTIVVLLNASDIYEADEGEIAIDASREASLEMSDTPTGDIAAGTPVATSLVSLWQTNSVGIRCERTLNWMRRRTVSVAYLTGVDWGGAVATA